MADQNSNNNVMKDVMPIKFVLDDLDPDISCFYMEKEGEQGLLELGKSELGKNFEKYQNQIPDKFYSFKLLTRSYTKVIARRFFNYIEQVYQQPGTAFILDITNLENFEFSAILDQLEYSKKFADGGLLRVGVIEPRSTIRKFMQLNITIQKRKTPIKVFEFAQDCVDWCIYTKLKTKEEKKAYKKQMKAEKKEGKEKEKSK